MKWREVGAKTAQLETAQNKNAFQAPSRIQLPWFFAAKWTSIKAGEASTLNLRLE